MAASRLSSMKFFRNSLKLTVNFGRLAKYADHSNVRSSSVLFKYDYRNNGNQNFEEISGQVRDGELSYQSLGGRNNCQHTPIASCSRKSSILGFSCAVAPSSARNLWDYRAYSTFFSDKGRRNDGAGVPPAASGTSDVNVSHDAGVASASSDLIDKVKDALKTAVDGAARTMQKAKEASDELNPHVQKVLDSHPYLKDVVIPAGTTFAATILAWLVMPRILRKFHKYSLQSPVSMLPGSISEEQVPYEKSFWGALEDPIRYLVTFMAFSQIGVMVAPTTIAAQYLVQAWRGAVILSFVWFLHRWKSNVFTRVSSSRTLIAVDREKLLALDKISSVGLFVIGIMALAEACGVAVQSILTVGGVGGVATAFAARDILGNVLSGLSMQFSKPFSVGDTIKAGAIEGQVIEMGLTSTSLLNAERFPVIVPNSLFSSQVIVNKSRAQCRAITSKIPLHLDDLSKIPQISDDIKGMLRSHSKVFLGKDAPYCFLSRVERSYAELTLGYNLKHMSKAELYSAEQDVLLQSVDIIKKHGVTLGSPWQETNS